MSSTHFTDVEVFNTRFGLLVGLNGPQHLTQRKLKERIECLLEELQEFAAGCGLIICHPAGNGNFRVEYLKNDQDLAAQADALVDLVYFAIGTAVMLGLPWQHLWDDVQRANLTKVPGPTKRVGHRRDLMKPPGWEGPRTEAILAAAGYDRQAFMMGKTHIDEVLCHDDL